MLRASLCQPFLLLLTIPALLAGTALGAQRAHLPPPDAAVTDVRLSDGDDAPRFTIVVRQGQITEILGADAAIPAGLREIDGEGALALPAFVDGYSRRGLKLPDLVAEQDAPLDVRADVSIDMRLANRKGIRPAFEAVEAVEVDEDLRKSWTDHGFGYALIAPGGELLSGSGTLLALREAALRDLVVVPEAFDFAAFRASGDGYPSTLMGYFAQLRQYFSDAARHADWLARFEAGRPGGRPPYDRELEAGAELLAGRMLVAGAQTAADAERWFRLGDELGLNIALNGGREFGRVAELLAERKTNVWMALDFGDEVEDPREQAKPQESKDEDEDSPDDAAEDGDGSDEDSAEEESTDEDSEEDSSYVEPYELRLERRLEWERDRDGALRLTEAGVPFAVGSDERKPKELLNSVRELIEAGLDREVALAALTSTPAGYLGLEERIGQLAPGFAASFVLWTADPLTDEDAEPTRVFVDGYPTRGEGEMAEADEAEADEDEKDGEMASEQDSDEEEADEVIAEPEPDRFPHPFETDADRKPELETGGSFLLRGATVHDAVSPARLADVLVTDGRIESIGEDLAAPDGVQVIEGEGRHVAPGAIDAHSHMGIARGVNEATVSISAEVDMTDVVDSEDIALYRAMAGGTTLIQILHGSANAIGGQAELLKLRGRGKTADEIRFEHGPKGIKFALGENPKRSNWGNPGERFPASRLGVEAVFYRAFERAREYQAELAAFEQAKARGEDPLPPRKDLRLAAVSAILKSELIVHSHCYRADEILMLMRAAENFDFRIGTLHHVLEGYKVAKEIAEHGAGTSTFSDWWAYKIEAYDAVPGNAQLLDQAGSVASIKSDSDELVRHLYHEAAKSVGYAAMDPVKALRLVTLNPAIQLGVEDRVGTLEAGKDADLVLFDRDPLSVHSTVLATFVEGECVFQRRDAFGLDEMEFPAPPLEPTATLELDPEQQVLAFVNGTVHTAEAAPLEGGVVLVQGGRILGVGADLELPQGARVIDATDKHLYPGLIALGTDLGLREIGAVAATNDQREFGGDQPDLSVAASIHADSAHLGVTRYNGVTRAQSIPRGFGAIHGQSAVIRLAGDTWEEMMVEQRDMLHVQVPRVPNDTEGESGEDRERREKRAMVLAEKFKKAAEYGRLRAEAEPGGFEPPPYDPRSEALARFARGEGRVGLHADNAATILAALEFAAEHELDAVLYGAREAWRVPEALAEAGISVVYGPVLDLPRSRFDPYDAPYATPAVLANAGVPCAIQTAGDENPRNLAYHAGFASTFGLGSFEALRAVTLHPATVLGLEEELGSLAPGKRADLVLCDGDLFEPASRVVGVWIDGQAASLANRHTELYERYRERLRALESAR